MNHWKKVSIIGFIILFLLIVQIRNPEISGPYRGIFGNILNPFIYGADKTFSVFRNIWGNYIWLVNVKSENIKLKEELNELSLNYDILSERLVQLEKLTNIISYKDNFSFHSVAANVIGRNSGGYMKTIIIDIGEDDGVKKNDPVVSFLGLVGRVSQTYKSSSKVVLISNYDSSVSVINSRTRAAGILKGDGRGKLYVDYYDRLDDVEIGDIFITSGMGKLFPKGIKVGEVYDIIQPPTGLFRQLVINSSIDFYKLEQVLVILNDNITSEISLDKE